MDAYKLSEKSKIDLAKIYEYSIENFGLKQAQKYLNGLHSDFQKLANNLDLGKDASMFSKRLLKYKFAKHIIFFKRNNRKNSKNEILIIRVLGERMNFERHF